jgi:hypothetical protein
MSVSNRTLQETVDDHHLEGFNDPNWNLGQIIAWAWTRSPFPVDALSTTEGFERRHHSMPPGLPHFALEYAQRCEKENGLKARQHFADLDQVRLALLRIFQSGRLSASGHHIESNERRTINVLDWADLVIGEGLTGELIVRRRGDGQAGWHDVLVQKHELLKVFPEVTGSDDKARGGRPTEFNWPDIRLYCLSLISKYGKPGRSNKKLPRQLDLIQLILEYCAERDIHPSPSTIKTRISQWLKEDCSSD